MQLRHIALESLKRRRGRGLFVVAALGLGIGTLVAMVSLSRAMQRQIGDELDRFGANIVMTPKTTTLDLSYGHVDVGGLAVDAKALTLADAVAVRTIHNARNISAVAPRLIGTIDGAGRPVLAIGAVFREEWRLRRWWRIDGEFPKSANQVLLGAEVAHTLEKRPGDRLDLGKEERIVAGVLEPTGALEDRAVIMDLSLAQDLLRRPGDVTVIDVSALCQGCPIEDIVQQIASVVPHARVTPIRQAVATREQAVSQMTRFALLISVVVLLAGGLVILTTMLSSVAERTQEIGILRAVGFRQAHVIQVILLEVLVLSTLGGMGGWAAGSAAARAFGGLVGGLAAPVAIDPWTLTWAVGLAVGVGLASGAYPAFRASRMDPAQAFRQV